MHRHACQPLRFAPGIVLCTGFPTLHSRLPRSQLCGFLPYTRIIPKHTSCWNLCCYFGTLPFSFVVQFFQTGSCSSFVSELQRGMVEALLIPHCMIGPKRRIFRVRTLQPPHCKRWGWQISNRLQIHVQIFNTYDLVMWPVSCDVLQLSHLKKSTVAPFQFPSYLLTSKPHSRPRSGDGLDLWAPLEDLGQ